MLLRFVRSLELLCCASLIALLYVISKFLYLGQSPFSIARLMSFRNSVFNSDRFLFCYTASFPRQTVDRHLASHASTTVLLNPSTSVSSSLLISPPSCRWAMLLPWTGAPICSSGISYHSFYLFQFLSIRSLEYSLELFLVSLAWCWLRIFVFPAWYISGQLIRINSRRHSLLRVQPLLFQISLVLALQPSLSCSTFPLRKFTSLMTNSSEIQLSFTGK